MSAPNAIQAVLRYGATVGNATVGRWATVLIRGAPSR